MDLLEFEELRRSETTDKLPFLDRENTHTQLTLINEKLESRKKQLTKLRNGKKMMSQQRKTKR